MSQGRNAASADRLCDDSHLSTSRIGRPKVGLGIYIYSCHAGELFGFVPVARDEQAFSC